MDIEIEKMRAEDFGSVKTIEVESNLSPWSQADYLNEIGRGGSTAIVAIEGTANSKRRVLGFLIGRICLENISTSEPRKQPNSRCDPENSFELLNIGVSASDRRRGVGAALLASAVGSANSCGVGTVWLEVRESNVSAIGFYEKCGFGYVYLRKALYRDPKEDGIGMKMILS